MACKLIALDLDGTVIGEDQTASPRVRRAIAQAQATGARVTVATGRSYLSTHACAQQLGIVEPYICYQGGLIVQPDGTVLHRVTLRPDLAEQILQTADELGWHAVLYVDGQVYATELRYPAPFYKRLINPSVQQIDNLYRLLERPADKVLLAAQDAEHAELIYAEMQRRFSDRMQIVRSHPLFVEANPPGVNKGAGLAWLANYLRVPQTQVMAIGDQDNDAPMLAWAGLGVAMGDASAACRAAAAWIAPPLSQDGAAVALEKFVLE